MGGWFRWTVMSPIWLIWHFTCWPISDLMLDYGFEIQPWIMLDCDLSSSLKQPDFIQTRLIYLLVHDYLNLFAKYTCRYIIRGIEERDNLFCLGILFCNQNGFWPEKENREGGLPRTTFLSIVSLPPPPSYSCWSPEYFWNHY